MKLPSKIIDRLLSVSLKWKLLIPFLFFAFTGTTTLVLIGLSTQYNLIHKEERSDIMHHYMHFMDRIEQKKAQVVSLATIIAENHEIKGLLSVKDRQKLALLLKQTFIRINKDFNIGLLHFHTPPAVSFLRLHHPSRYGEDMASYRKTILEVVRTRKSLAGLETGIAGLSIRGVSPVFFNETLVGTIEIGMMLDSDFLEDFYRTWSVDVALYGIGNEGVYQMISQVGKGNRHGLNGIHLDEYMEDSPTIMLSPEKYPHKSILYGPIKDFSGKKVAMVEFVIDRSETQDRLNQTLNLMLIVGLVGITVSFLLTYLVIQNFIKPIKELAVNAQKIALGKSESRLKIGPNDEVGSLARALNTMLEALKERRTEIEHYARTLENRVQERTADLVASEEKYRALVENVPLIVYRVLRDGTTEFVNSYMTESLGYTIEEAVSNKRFWRDMISGDDLTAFKAINENCFRKGKECRVENIVRAKDGRLRDFITHAIPARDSHGNIKWVDGIMLDITELKRLQERALLTEEIRTLGEISAVLAHEIRNPLITAGGFARRLHESLEDDDNKKIAGIIVKEVARLEQLLKVIFSSIEPFDLVLSRIDLNEILISWTEILGEALESKGGKFIKEFNPDLPEILGDKDRLSQAFENILKHAIVAVHHNEDISITTKSEDDQVSVLISHKIEHLSDDDLEKFFFPHIESDSQWSLVDLPLSKIIIHRHRGRIDISREGINVLIMKIEFPIKMDQAY